MNRRAFLSIAFAFLGHLDSTIHAAQESSPAERRILFVGNSITLHGPSKEIGWTGHWGMAASAEEKDYAHLVAAEMAKRDGVAVNFKVANLADFERRYEGYDASARLKKELAYQAGIVVVALGENVPALNSEEAKTKFKESLIRLLTMLKNPTPPTPADGAAVASGGVGPPKIYVRSCFWPDAAKDAVLKQACKAVGGVFIDISDLAKDEGNFARSERKIAHAGVAAHPGDKGMRAIADALLAKMK